LPTVILIYYSLYGVGNSNLSVLLSLILRSTSVAPSALLKDMCEINPTFAGYGQQVLPFHSKFIFQDSQEFLRSFLDRLHEELKISSSDSNHSAVSDIFEGLLLSKVKCLKCQKVQALRQHLCNNRRTLLLRISFMTYQ
jgi:ubiquitin C-terminal hydrolase